jgi:hypothetical protein
MMKTDHPSTEPLLVYLKTLADESRLALLRRVTQREQTVGELSDSIGLGEPTVSHHLSRLREMGFVSLRMDGNQRYYRLNQSGLDRFKQLVSQIEQFSPDLPGLQAADYTWMDALGEDWDEADRRVLREHIINGVLTHWPNKQKKLLVILRWLATLFEPDRLYTEGEVNGILKAVYAEDFVSLRRDLVDMGYLHRERGGGKYWLAPLGLETK